MLIHRTKRSKTPDQKKNSACFGKLVGAFLRLLCYSRGIRARRQYLIAENVACIVIHKYKIAYSVNNNIIVSVLKITSML